MTRHLTVSEYEFELILGAITVAIESTQWKRLRRSEYDPPMRPNIEAGVRAGEDLADDSLRHLLNQLRGIR